MTTFGAVASNTALTRFVPMNATNFRKGATAPTDVTIGTTPSVPALLFDAVAELASTSEHIPDDWDSTTDPVFVLKWSLVNVQINGDVASISLDYTMSQPLTTGAGPDKTSTNQLATTTVTTGNGLAVNDVYTTEFTLDRADGSNPIAAGYTFHAEIHLTNVIGVAAIHALDGHLRYEAAY